jgi:hypothetical protein
MSKQSDLLMQMHEEFQDREAQEYRERAGFNTKKEQIDVMIRELKENPITYKWSIPKKYKRRVLTFN